MELEALQKIAPDIEKLGASLVSISPQQREYMLETAQKHRLNFELLRDEKNRIAKQYGLVYTVPEDLKAIYLSFGIDLERYNGDTSWELPMPGRVVIGQDAVVRNVAVDPDYTIRPEPEETIAVLRALKEG